MANWGENFKISEIEAAVNAVWHEIGVPELMKVTGFVAGCVTFLDGPPFATGKMHYGHIMVSSVKDTLARFFKMCNYDISRYGGFDTHGLPIEILAKNNIGYETRQDLVNYGIARHNQLCRNLVASCIDNWHKDFARIARWTHADREYRTMDTAYMESVIWAFSKLYEKGVIYQGYKIMPYSTACTTVLANFEAKSEYQDVIDRTLVCKFLILDTQHSKFKTTCSTFLLAWTTVPWTLYANAAICTATQGKIVEIYDQENACCYLMSQHVWQTRYCQRPGLSLMGNWECQDMQHIVYATVFTNTATQGRVLIDASVEMQGRGTGFVHYAPEFGEDDYRVCEREGIASAARDMVDEDGCFTEMVPEYQGKLVWAANATICRELVKNGVAFEAFDYTHSYPICYRTRTRLIYRTVQAWFLRTSDPAFRAKMLALNTGINWQPANVSRTFANWLENTTDWCVSRDRYWGTPIPVWRSQDGAETRCIGSIAELCELAGVANIDDLHIDVLDKIQIPNRDGTGFLQRVPGVLDCWFESGCAPFARQHYPFENPDCMQQPCDFICESNDQTRGWFYTLMVLSALLFDQMPFKNVIVTGIMNAADGQKMSKSRGNYTDSQQLIEIYGADTVRLYCLKSQAVKGENTRFNEADFAILQQKGVTRFYHIAAYLCDKIQEFHSQYPGQQIDMQYDTSCPVNAWIVNRLHNYAQKLYRDLSTYHITSVAANMLAELDNLSMWYIKMIRTRLEMHAENMESVQQHLQTLLYVTHTMAILSAPIMPYMSDHVYNMLPKSCLRYASVHQEKYPQMDVADNSRDSAMDIVKHVVKNVRKMRVNARHNTAHVFAELFIGDAMDADMTTILPFIDYICDLCNIQKITLVQVDDFASVNYSINRTLARDMGNAKCGRHIKRVTTWAQTLCAQDLPALDADSGFTVTSAHYDANIICHKHISEKWVTAVSGATILALDDTITREIAKASLLTMLKTAVQMYRREIAQKKWNTVAMKIWSNNTACNDFISENLADFITSNDTVEHTSFWTSDAFKFPIRCPEYNSEIDASCFVAFC